MFSFDLKLPGAWPLAVVLSALALAAAGCGGSDGDDAATGDQAAGQQEVAGETEPKGSSSPRPAAGGSAAEQVRGVVSGFQKAIVSGDSATICKSLTNTARREAVIRAKNAKKGKTCEANFDDILANRLTGASPPKIQAVKVKGDKATVTMKEKKAGVYDVTAVKEGDAWRIDLRFGVSTPVQAGRS